MTEPSHTPSWTPSATRRTVGLAGLGAVYGAVSGVALTASDTVLGHPLPPRTGPIAFACALAFALPAALMTAFAERRGSAAVRRAVDAGRLPAEAAPSSWIPALCRRIERGPDGPSGTRFLAGTFLVLGVLQIAQHWGTLYVFLGILTALVLPTVLLYGYRRRQQDLPVLRRLLHELEAGAALEQP